MREKNCRAILNENRRPSTISKLKFYLKRTLLLIGICFFAVAGVWGRGFRGRTKKKVQGGNIESEGPSNGLEALPPVPHPAGGIRDHTRPVPRHSYPAERVWVSCVPRLSEIGDLARGP